MKKQSRNLLLIIALVTLLSLMIVSIVTYVTHFQRNGLSGKNSDWADFATYVNGVIGCLLAPFSAVLIYLTYQSQLKFSREQMLAVHVQQFEATFFSLLNNQREILKSLSWTGPRDMDTYNHLTYKADEFIDFIAREINGYFDEFHNYKINRKEKEAQIAMSDEETDCKINKLYCFIFNSARNELGHYFRHLYHILKFVYESGISDTKKYTDILQSQMSDSELYITMYNCMSEHGRDKFLPLADQYGFFENVDSRGELFDKHKILFFKNTRFKTNHQTVYGSMFSDTFNVI